MWNKCSTFAPKLLIIMYTKKKKDIYGLSKGLLSIVLLTFFLTACMSDSKEVTIKNNTCFISHVTFGSFKRKMTTKASDGITDSTYYQSFTDHKLTFTINQKTLLIENRDSLPYNTDLSRVVMNMSYNGALAYIRPSDAWEDDPWDHYSSSDSIDLRVPLHIRVVATDNTERKYTLKVNVHTMESDSLKWHPVACDNAIQGIHPMKATSLKEQVAVLVNDGAAVAWITHGLSSDGEWNRHVTNLPQNTDVSSLAKGPNAVFVNTDDGGLYSSNDGIDWEKLYQHEGLRLVGVSNDKLYAIFNGALNSIYHGAGVWKAETLDADFSLMPDMEIADITYPQTSTLTRMIIAGNRSVEGDSCAVVWSKCWTDFEDEDAESWMHYGSPQNSKAAMPMLTQMTLLHYDNNLMAIGGVSKDGKAKALERFFISKDNGLTWERQQDIIPPAEIQGCDGYITATADKDNFIWLIAGGKVYRGRINRLGFARP